jgi:CBS domain-containing protein
MTRNAVTVLPETLILDVANEMLENHVSGLPVLECIWQARRLSSAHSANDCIHERGRKAEDVMTCDPVVADEDTSPDEPLHLMEKNGIKCMPVVRDDKLVGIITRADLLQAVASMAKEIPDPMADDEYIRDRIIRTLEATDWRPTGLQAVVRNGGVHLHDLIINDDSTRRASIVAAENTTAVKEVHDHLCFVGTRSVFYMESPERHEGRKLTPSPHGKSSKWRLAHSSPLNRCCGAHLAVRRARRLGCWYHSDLADDHVDHRHRCHRRRMESATRALDRARQPCLVLLPH